MFKTHYRIHSHTFPVYFFNMESDVNLCEKKFFLFATKNFSL